MKTSQLLAVALAFLMITSLATSAGEAQEAPIDRTTPRIQAPKYDPVTELDASNVKPPPRFEVKAPEGTRIVVQDRAYTSPIWYTP